MIQTVGCFIAPIAAQKTTANYVMNGSIRIYMQMDGHTYVRFAVKILFKTVLRKQEKTMDIEQLKMILEAAAAAGDGAMKVVFIWFAYKFFATVLVWGFWSGVVYAGYRFFSNMASAEYGDRWPGRLVRPAEAEK